MKTYGKLRYTVDEITGRQPRNVWVVEDCPPHVTIRFKRVFSKVWVSSYDAHTLSDTAENARDLEWFLDRYPMKMTAKARAHLEARAREFDDQAQTVQAILTGKKRLKSIDLALPLREYQRQAVEMMREMQGLLLADELGLGKTASAIGLLAYEDALPALVVTMTHLPTQWRDELARFAPKLKVHILKRGTSYDLSPDGEDPDVIISNYHKLAGHWELTLAGKVKTVVFDEAQELRKPGSQKYSACKHVASESVYTLGLTGTPIYNQGSEFHAVMDVIKPGALGTRTEFVREWCGDGPEGREMVANPRAFGSYVRDSGLMLRRTRVDVGRELPALTRVPHHIDANLEALDRLSVGCRELALFILGRGESPLSVRSEDGSRRGQEMLASQELSNKMRQATGIAKAPYVADFVEMLAEQEQKIVLYGWHREVYKIWLERLAGLKPVMFTGSETAKEKDESKKRFIEGDSRLLIMSLRSGAGLDGIQKVCRTVVKGELDWAYGVHEQCEGRVYRDGQADPVAVYYLIAQTGSDPIVSDVLGIKRGQLEGLRDPDGSLVEKLQVDPDRIKKLAEFYLSERGRRGAEKAADRGRVVTVAEAMSV